MVKLREKFYPKITQDWISFIFMMIIIPLFYWFDMFVVLPDKHSHSLTWFAIHFIFGTFLMVNITGNLVAVILIDSSTQSIAMGIYVPGIDVYCYTCRKMMPERSWHCNTCGSCILKRDHHCTFTGCCIGYSNHRYFIMFLLYFFIGCCYSAYLSYFYIALYLDFEFVTMLNIMCPIVFYLFGLSPPLHHYIVILLILSVVGSLISGILLYIHLKLIIKGVVLYEDRHDKPGAGFGKKYNLITVLGENWYLTWISPFIRSDLRDDGTYWEERQPITRKDIKFR